VFCLSGLALAGGVSHAGEPGLTQPLLLVTFSYPPFVEERPGKRTDGPMVELVTEAFRRIGQPIAIELFPLARALSMLETGRADAMFTMKRTPERVTRYWIPKHSLMTQDFVVFVRKDSGIRYTGDLQSLSARSIGVVDQVSYGSRFDTAAREGAFRKLEVTLSFELNFKKLLAGRMDVVVSSRLAGLSMLKRLNAESMVQVSGPPIETVQSFLMFSKARVSREQVAQFDRALDTMQQDGSLKRIEQMYLR
jgi:polar amino acid transport system substrate-binding protein